MQRYVHNVVRSLLVTTQWKKLTVPSQYSKEVDILNEVIYNYKLPLGERLNAWAAWCKLFDIKEAADKVQTDACKEHAL